MYFYFFYLLCTYGIAPTITSAFQQKNYLQLNTLTRRTPFQSLMPSTSRILHNSKIRYESTFFQTNLFNNDERNRCKSSLYNSFHDQDQGIPTSSVTVGIAGAGAASYATAALLAIRGHDPMIWSPSGESAPPVVKNVSLSKKYSEVSASGAIETIFHPRIAFDAKELAFENEVIILALPANGHMKVMQLLAPHLKRHHTVIISSHSSLGAIYLTKLIQEQQQERGQDANENWRLPIVAWGTTVATARRTSASSVQVCTLRTLVDMCTIPYDHSEHGLSVCQNLFGRRRFQQRDGLLAITLSNLNAQNHLGIVLGNMSRIDRNEKWSQGLNITPSIGRFLEALDKERLAIASTLGLEVRTIFDHFSLSFQVPKNLSVSDMNQCMVEKGNDVNGPASTETRYVTEDVPYGLTTIVSLGKLVGQPAFLHESGIRIVSAMYGRDFGAENSLLQSLDLEMVSLEQLKQAGKTGIL